MDEEQGKLLKENDEVQGESGKGNDEVLGESGKENGKKQGELQKGTDKAQEESRKWNGEEQGQMRKGTVEENKKQGELRKENDELQGESRKGTYDEQEESRKGKDEKQGELRKRTYKKHEEQRELKTENNEVKGEPRKGTDEEQEESRTEKDEKQGELRKETDGEHKKQGGLSKENDELQGESKKGTDKVQGESQKEKDAEHEEQRELRKENDEVQGEPRKETDEEQEESTKGKYEEQGEIRKVKDKEHKEQGELQKENDYEQKESSKMSYEKHEEQGELSTGNDKKQGELTKEKDKEQGELNKGKDEKQGELNKGIDEEQGEFRKEKDEIQRELSKVSYEKHKEQGESKNDRDEKEEELGQLRKERNEQLGKLSKEKGKEEEEQGESIKRISEEYEEKEEWPYCLLVGHLSESEIVQQAVKDEFPTKTLIFPREGSCAILKGAVMLGHDLSKIEIEEISKSKENKGVEFLAVVAIDFGTAYSGFSFSTIDEYKKKPLKIQTNTWKSGKEYKTNTSLLLDQRKGFVEFGSKAQDAYIRKSAKERQEMFYFENFKLNLYNSTEPLRTLRIMDIQGRRDKSVLAQEVFAIAIKALKDSAIKLLETRGQQLTENEIRWVLTVPAIWPEDAKMFMRSSAEQAGIPSRKLLLALEPEVASLYAQFQATEQSKDGQYKIALEGTRYMVVDVGGGTTDITVHEKLPNRKVKELNKASGADCGGKSVDAEFLKLLDDMFGKDKMRKLKETYTKSYIQLYKSFEEIKPNVTTEDTTAMQLRFPRWAFEKLLGGAENLDNFFKQQNIDYEDGKLFLSASKLRELFKPTIEKILNLIKSALNFKESEYVSFIMLVGGFANNSLLREAVKKNFEEKKVIVIPDAGLAVLKGAVLYGHDPETINIRVTRYTYGVNLSTPFIPRVHEPTRRYIDSRTGMSFCSGAFCTIIKQNKTVKIGTIVKKTYSIAPYMTETQFEFYTSDKDDPIYTDDRSCRKIGTLHIIVPIPSEEKRKVDVEYIFGNTEIEVRAKETKYGIRATSKLTFH